MYQHRSSGRIDLCTSIDPSAGSIQPPALPSPIHSRLFLPRHQRSRLLLGGVAPSTRASCPTPPSALPPPPWWRRAISAPWWRPWWRRALLLAPPPLPRRYSGVAPSSLVASRPPPWSRHALLPSSLRWRRALLLGRVASRTPPRPSTLSYANP